jgi:rubrerythrin
MKKITVILALLLFVSPAIAQEDAAKTTENPDKETMHRSLFRKTLIELLVEVEQTTGDLYKVYAEKFPGSENFWNDIAADEERHASMVAGLHEMSEEYKIYPYDDDRVRFNEDYAQGTLDYIKNQILMARKGKISLEEALNVALNIEKSLVEKEYYTIFEGDGPAARVILQTMVIESKEHERKVIGLIEKLKDIEGR